jgi:hypothetical protein
MTPLGGFVIAIIAAWIIRDARRAAATVIVPYLAVVAAQTWAIDAGYGHSPPSTVWPFSRAISYYVVQAIILALALGVAALLGTVLARRTAAPGGTQGLGRRTVIASVVDGVLTAAFIAGALLDSAPMAHHSANGSPPWYGLLGVAAMLVSLIVLSVLAFTGRRAKVKDGSAATEASTAKASTAMVSGSRVAAVAAIGALGVLAATAGLAPARAETATSGRIVHIYETSVGGPTNHDVITGAFTDYGVDHLGVLDHGNVNLIVLSKGSFEANVSKLHARLTIVSSNNRACTLVLKSTAPVSLSHGTGRYRGIHGTLTITVVNAVVFPKKRNGSCNEELPVAVQNLTLATGSGRVSF